MSFNIFDNKRQILPQPYEKDEYYAFFSENNIKFISQQITQRLEGVHPDNKHIIVPKEQIISVMDSFYQNEYRDVDTMSMATIAYITNHIKTEFGIEKNNNNLNIWTTQYTPDTGMQRSEKIKLREKRPNPFSYIRY